MCRPPLVWLVLDAVRCLLISGAMHVLFTDPQHLLWLDIATPQLLASQKVESCCPATFPSAFCNPVHRSFHSLLPIKCQLLPFASHQVSAFTLCFLIECLHSMHLALHSCTTDPMYRWPQQDRKQCRKEPFWRLWACNARPAAASTIPPILSPPAHQPHPHPLHCPHMSTMTLLLRSSP